MSEALKNEPSVWTQRWVNSATASGIGSALLAAIGAYGTGFGLWHFTVGFVILAVGLLAAVIALLSAPIALIKARKTSLSTKGVWFGLLCTVLLLGIMVSWVRPGLDAPLIHDVTTDLGNPPAFQKLKLRSDNLAGAGSMENWRAMHAKSYSDLYPLSIRAPQAEVMAAAEKIVRERGWEIALVSKDRIEATDTVSLFRFKDDVVILVRPDVTPGVTQVEMRSVSRVGAGDLGVNARRVRAYLADLRAAGKDRVRAPKV